MGPLVRPVPITAESSVGGAPLTGQGSIHSGTRWTCLERFGGGLGSEEGCWLGRSRARRWPLAVRAGPGGRRGLISDVWGRIRARTGGLGRPRLARSMWAAAVVAPAHGPVVPRRTGAPMVTAAPERRRRDEDIENSAWGRTGTGPSSGDDTALASV